MINTYNLTTLYVSQKYGSDHETGFSKKSDEKRNGPLKTIEKALDYVKEMRFFGALQPVTIKILDEEYFVEKPIIIDNGVYNVTIEPYTKTLISGGIRISGFKNDVFNNTPCFSAYIPQVKENGLWFTDFYVDSAHAAFTQFPKDGLLTPLSVDNNDKNLHTHSKWFIAKKEDLEQIKHFKNFGDCFISYNHYWVDEHTPIESYDTKTGKIVCKYLSRFSVSSDYAASAMAYKIENVAEMFQNPNEWYLDRETAKVYYIPKNKEQTPENITAYAPITDKLLIICGTADIPCENITIRGFEFAYTTGDYMSKLDKREGDSERVEYEDAAFASDGQSLANGHASIEFEFARHCAIEKCTLHSLGVHAIRLKNGCNYIRITDNNIYDIGGGGVSISGEGFDSDPSLHTGNNFIDSNLIKSIGRRYLSSCGILLRHSFSNTVSHNDISDLYYTGISVGWVWGYKNSISNNNIIEYNHIHNLGQGVLSDMGGIYLLGKQQGTIVRANLIHDVKSKHYGGWGIYTDEGSSYITIENNICYNLSCNCYHQHYGCMNTARNNIFVMSKDEPVKLSRNEMHTGMIFEQNIIVSNNTPLFRTGYEDEDSGSIHTLSTHSNLIYDISGKTPVFITIGKEKYSLEDAQKILGIDDNSVIADPKFAGFENFNFTLSDDSPAYDIGFKPIDVKNIGILNR